MRVRREGPLTVGWFATALQPPQLAAVFVVKVTYELRGDALVAAADPLLPSGDVADPDGRGGLCYASDFVPFKPRTDVLVAASAHAPRGEPVRFLPVSVRVGDCCKRLLVAGDRVWRRRLLGREPGDPEPFVQMPLVWSRALGGPQDPANPAGIGRDGAAVPNVERPDQLLRAPGDRVAPAGLLPVAADWQPRAALRGTCRGSYLRDRWPWLPADQEWRWFNAAPADQQLDGWLRGDEELAFENLHRERADLRVRLPGERARCFATFADGAFREVELRADTLFADLENDRVVVVWRGHIDVANLKLTGLEHVFALTEPLAPLREPERELAHYRELRDRAPPEDAEEAAARAEDAQLEADLAALEREAAAVRERAAAHEAEIERLTAEAEALLAGHEQELLMIEIGGERLDPALLRPRPPPPLAEAMAGLEASLGALRARAPDFAPPDLPEHAFSAEELAEAEALLQEPLEVEAGPEPFTRERALAAARGPGLAGAQLSGLDLSGADLAGCDLGGCDLTAADLSGAVLRGADLRRALLGEAVLAGADLTGAVLDGADLTGARLDGAVLQDASVAGAVLEGLALAGLDLSGLRGRAPQMAEADLTGAVLRGAILPQADLTGCRLDGADLRAADLTRARLSGSSLQKADLRGAVLERLQAGDGADLSSADLRHARAAGAVLTGARLCSADLRYADLRGALLGEADLAGADLSRADLGGAGLDDARLPGARLLQGNLPHAALERADLGGADLRGANLYAAGLWQAGLADADLGEANLKGTTRA